MAIQRIQISKNKKSISSKHQKREIATLLQNKKEELARIKVEHIIRDDFTIEAFEILELLCELVHERIRLVTASKECPADLQQPILSLVWASTQVDIAELLEVKNQFTKKFGSKFIEPIFVNPSEVLNERLYRKLSIQPPSTSLIFSYLEEIAKEYSVDWTPTDVGLPTEGISSECPLPAPIGFSVPMAPGTNLAQVYQSTNSFPPNALPPPSFPHPSTLLYPPSPSPSPQYPPMNTFPPSPPQPPQPPQQTFPFPSPTPSPSYYPPPSVPPSSYPSPLDLPMAPTTSLTSDSSPNKNHLDDDNNENESNDGHPGAGGDGGMTGGGGASGGLDMSFEALQARFAALQK